MELDRETLRSTDIDTFRNILCGVLNDRLPPDIDFFKKIVNIALEVYDEEDENIRPKAADDKPGGLLDLRSNKPVVLLPDLHARRWFLQNVIDYIPNVEIPLSADSNDEEETDSNVAEETDDESGILSENEADEAETLSDDAESENDETAADDETAEEADISADEDEADDNTEEISVLDYVPPEEIPAPSEKDNKSQSKSVKDIADKLIEQLHNIHEDVSSFLTNISASENDAEDGGESDEPSDEDTDHCESLHSDNAVAADNEKTILELLEENRIIVLCVGDGVHGEASFAARWRDAYTEFLDGFDNCPNMDAEIADSFNLMIAVMLLKIRYPDSFHFLKGNHENICNETGGGNYAFAKFANEGQMVLSYFRMKYDLELISLYSDFEKSLPLFAVGWNFLASHAEPASFYDYDHILNYHINEDVILGLTWTDNYQSMPGTIDVMLDYYITDNDSNTYYFGGHRPIKGIYYRINGDRYVQFHNPWIQIIGIINQHEAIDLDRDIIQIGTQPGAEDDDGYR